MKTSRSRRSFLKASLCGTGLLTYPAWLQALPSRHPYLTNIGLQLWTVRDPLKEDVPGTFKAVKESGYAQVELMDVIDQQNFAPICRDLGLKITSSFFSWRAVTGTWDQGGITDSSRHYGIDRVIEEARKLKLKYVVFGYLPKEERGSLDAFRKTAEQLNEAGAKVSDAGMQLCYHNHSFEFLPMQGRMTPYDILMDRLDPELVKFELDIFWADIGGWNSIALIKRLKKRIAQLHLKDLKPGTPIIYDEGKVPADAFKELGNGIINMEKVIETAMKYRIPQCHVEQDQSPAPLASIRQSVDHLRNL